MSDVLVLLTTDYPAAKGDASFLANEIDELAAQFDRVVVFSYQTLAGFPVSLPPNVSYGGALSDSPRAGAVRALLSARLGRALRTAVAETRSGSVRKSPELALGNIFTGMRFADYIARELKRLGVTREDDVFVYSFWGTHSALALPFLRGAKRASMRVHRFDLYEEQNPHLPLRASLFDSVDAVVSISEDGNRYLRSRYSARMLDPNKVVVSRLGTQDPIRATDRRPTIDPRAGGDTDVPLDSATDRVDNADDHASVSAVGAGREGGSLAWPSSGALHIVSCSSLIPVKNVGALIPALEALAARGPVEWMHLGGGPLEDELRGEAAAAMKRQPNFHADLKGWTPHDEVMSFYRESRPHLLVNVSHSEGVPVSIMEALSFGIPVVATDVGGTGEIVGRERGSGILIPEDPTLEQIAEAIFGVATNWRDFAPRRVWSELSDAESNAKHIAQIVKGGLE